MKCSQKLLEAYLNHEMSEKECDLLKQHIAKCPKCAESLKSLISVNTTLSSYKHHDINNALVYSLMQLPFRAKKRFSLFYLLPREFAFTAASIVVALFAGIIFSSQIFNANAEEMIYSYDYYDQISLVSLIDR